MYRNILFKSSYPINDKINIIIPTVEQVLDNENAYYGLVSSLTAMPIDMMVQLDDIGIDFTEIDEYQLFQLMFMGIRSQDTSLIFGDLDLSKFEPAVNEENQQLVFLDAENDIVIDRAIYDNIANALRQIHHLEKNYRKPGNEEAKAYMLEKERRKLRRKKRTQEKSQLEPLIVSVVNTAEFKYDYEGTKKLTIYQFNESVRQVVRKTDYDNRMHGVYSGTVSAKDLDQSELTWIIQH